jgi:hypothetical protein
MTQTVEVTRLVPQTIEITKIIPQTVIVSKAVQNISTPIITTPIVINTAPNQETAYYDCIIVLAQYYTLLDQKAYGLAYQLLSPSRLKASTLEEYKTGHEMINIHTYRLISAQPYYEWAKNQGFKPSPDLETKKRFYIRVYAEGEGGMAGSVTNGIHTFFATMVWENGEWKIYSINTSPQ